MGTPHQRPREPAWRLSRLPGASLEAPQHHSFVLEGPACWVLLKRPRKPAWRLSRLPGTTNLMVQYYLFQKAQLGSPARRAQLEGTPHQTKRTSLEALKVVRYICYRRHNQEAQLGGPSQRALLIRPREPAWRLSWLTGTSTLMAPQLFVVEVSAGRPPHLIQENHILQ